MDIVWEQSIEEVRYWAWHGWDSLFLSGDSSNIPHEFPGITDFIDMKVNDKIKCNYCGRKNNLARETCAGCGAVL